MFFCALDMAVAHVLLCTDVWSCRSMCKLSWFLKSVFYIRSWLLYQSSLHSSRFIQVWVTSFAWQIPDVLPDFVSGSFLSLPLTTCVCMSYMPMKKYSLIRDLPPFFRKRIQLSSLRAIANTFVFYPFYFLALKTSCLYILQYDVSFCNPFPLWESWLS